MILFWKVIPYKYKSRKKFPPMIGSQDLEDHVRPEKSATSTATPQCKYTESLTFSTPNCIYVD